MRTHLLVLTQVALAACASAAPPPVADPPPAPTPSPLARAVAPGPTPQPGPAPTQAEPPNDREPSRAPRRFALLNGRLTAVLPAGSREAPLNEEAQPLEAGVPGSNSCHRVTNAFVDVVIPSFELFALAEDDLEAQVRAAVARMEHPIARYRLEPVAARPPLRVVQLVPETPASSGLAGDDGPMLLAAMLYVAHADGTVQAIELHVADAAAAPRAVELGRQIGESLEPGPLALPRTAGPRTLQVYGDPLTAQLPDGFVAYLEPGMDTMDVYLEELSPIATRRRTIVLSFNTWPPPLEPGRPVRGRLFGQSATMHSETSNGMRRLHGMVEIVPWFIIVDMSASTAAGLDGLRAIAETLQYPPSPEAADNP